MQQYLIGILVVIKYCCCLIVQMDTYLGAHGYDDGDANLCKSVGGEGRRLPPLISTTQHASGCPSLLPRHPHHTLEKATKTFILEEKRI